MPPVSQARERLGRHKGEQAGSARQSLGAHREAERLELTAARLHDVPDSASRRVCSPTPCLTSWRVLCPLWTARQLKFPRAPMHGMQQRRKELFSGSSTVPKGPESTRSAPEPVLIAPASVPDLKGTPTASLEYRACA